MRTIKVLPKICKEEQFEELPNLQVKHVETAPEYEIISTTIFSVVWDFFYGKEFAKRSTIMRILCVLVFPLVLLTLLILATGEGGHQRQYRVPVDKASEFSGIAVIDSPTISSIPE